MDIYEVYADPDDTRRPEPGSTVDILTGLLGT
jgi:hypothetical protein